MLRGLSGEIDPAPMNRLRRREAVEGYLFALPGILGLILFIIGPILASLLLSMTAYDVLSPPKWIGVANYAKALTNDPLFWKALYNTTYYTFLSVPLAMVFSLACAVILNSRLLRIGSMFRVIYFLPAVTSGVAISFLWLFLLDPTVGIINRILKVLFDVTGPLWLQSEIWAKPGMVLMSLWSVGTTVTIYLAGLQGIPEYYYDAASVDGAGAARRFLSITLPMLSPTLLFTFIMGIIGSFQVFLQAYVMTAGGPLNSTLFYVLYLYRHGFVYFNMGYASALAWILFVVILALTLLVFRSSPLWVFYEAKRGKGI